MKRGNSRTLVSSALDGRGWGYCGEAERFQWVRFQVRGCSSGCEVRIRARRGVPREFCVYPVWCTPAGPGVYHCLTRPVCDICYRWERRGRQSGVAARVLDLLRHRGHREQRPAHPALRVSRQHQRRPPRLPQKVAHGGETATRHWRPSG